MEKTNSQHPLVTIENLTVKRNGQVVLDSVQLTILAGEQWAITGASGSGKTSLAQALVGGIFHAGNVTYRLDTGKADQQVLLVEQQHHFKNLSNTGTFYYQQRFNSMDAGDSMTAAAYLHSASADVLSDELMDQLQVSSFLGKPLIQLSNGENKRLQLAMALAKKPAMLILDNPFTGLDVIGRKTLHAIINAITQQGIHLLLITGTHELPASVTHVAVLEKGRLIYKGAKEEYAVKKEDALRATSMVSPATAMGILKNRMPALVANFETAIRMKSVSVKYGDRVIFEGLDWEVRKGERWNVAGPNGSGKSTLLSLITGDNPQAYANEIYLFDRRRGSGESIWDIKKQIGYVSPELHLFFDASNTWYEVVASGLFDTIGLFRQLSEVQEAQVSAIIELLQLDALQYKPLFQLSLGEQRMVLLARALVKNPPLLILDEPCQGLDDQQSAAIRELVNMLCVNMGTTLLYVSHYEKDVPECVDRFLQLG